MVFAAGMRLRATLRLLLPALLLLWGPAASAYPWMIKHQELQCSTCHLDPAGGGVLNDYGRGQSDVLLRFHYGESEDEDTPDHAQFMFGALALPDWLFVSTNVRAGVLANKSGPMPLAARPIVMATDVRVGVEHGSFRAAGSLGYAIKGAARAAVTPGAENTVVSREHWAGWAFKGGSLLVRAGRMNLPFGLRNLEHTSFVRAVTRTDTNMGQQHGAALAYDTGSLRAEVMAVAGNFQVAPDSFRERGYAGYVERRFGKSLGAGFSSLALHTRRDIDLRYTRTRTAHGPFVRYAPIQSFTLLAEANALVSLPRARDEFGRKKVSVGYVGFAQGDFEPIQGLHFMGTVEALDARTSASGPMFGFGLTALWFFAPHADLRIDGHLKHVPSNEGATQNQWTVVTQLHFYL